MFTTHLVSNIHPSTSLPYCNSRTGIGDFFWDFTNDLLVPICLCPPLAQVLTFGFSPDEFCREMNGAPLPPDSAARKNFDIQATFVLGDPAAHFDRPSNHTYECKYDEPYMGFPVWEKIFTHILRYCGYLVDYDTIYVLVDTRNLAEQSPPPQPLPCTMVRLSSSGSGAYLRVFTNALLLSSLLLGFLCGWFHGLVCMFVLNFCLMYFINL